MKPSAFKAVTGFVRKKYPVVKGVVYYNGKPVETRVVPGYRDLIIAFSGTYGYAGDGWWHLQGACVSVYVQPPGNWTRAIVYVRAKKGWAAHMVLLFLQVEHFDAVGWGIYTDGEFAFEFINGVGRGSVLKATGDYGEFAVGVSAGNIGATPVKTPGVDKGWLIVDALGGELWFKVEFYG
ncbi:hypothetical protein [Infirmifilum sp. SLHALR2]|nr:MAG: hypothetical protein B7L53_05140 [Thermofilum sp. NZ13]